MSPDCASSLHHAHLYFFADLSVHLMTSFFLNLRIGCNIYFSDLLSQTLIKLVYVHCLYCLSVSNSGFYKWDENK